MKFFCVRRQVQKYRVGDVNISEDFLKIVEEAKPNKDVFVVLDDVSEDSSYTELDHEFLQHIKNSLEKLNLCYCFITNIRNKNFNFPFKNIIFITNSLISYYHQFFGLNKNNINHKWNFNSKKGLFIPGKIFAYNRCVLMYALYKENLLPNLNWSFYGSEKNKERLKKIYFSNLNNDEFENFINHCNRKIDINDDTRIIFDSNGEVILLSPWPYDSSIYSNTAYSIVSETYFHYGKIPTLTEKTFRPILNKHPFIILGASGTLDLLKNLGFKTFIEYLPINYDLIINEEERLSAVVKCIKYFSENYLNFLEDIQLDIEHNYRKLIEINQKQIVEIENFLPKEFDDRTLFNWTYIRNS